MAQIDIGQGDNEEERRKNMIENEILEKVCKQIFEEKPPVLQTGFRDLDIILSGVENSSLLTIGSRPAMGKTAFATSIMLNLLEQNKKCLFFIFDMSEEELIKRLVAQIAEVDAFLLGHNPKEISKRAQSAEKIKEALEKLSKYDLTIQDNILNIQEIREQIEQHKPEFVFIDYLQLIDVPLKRPRSESFEKVMKELKQIAKDNNCIIFITSQLSRASECRCDKRPLLSDLRESGAIENISDVVMFVYRDEYYHHNDDEYLYNKGKAEIIVAKNKYGTVGTVNLLFRSSITKFLEPVHYDTF